MHREPIPSLSSSRTRFRTSRTRWLRRARHFLTSIFSSRVPAVPIRPRAIQPTDADTRLVRSGSAAKIILNLFSVRRSQIQSCDSTGFILFVYSIRYFSIKIVIIIIICTNGPTRETVSRTMITLFTFFSKFYIYELNNFYFYPGPYFGGGAQV